MRSGKKGWKLSIRQGGRRGRILRTMRVKELKLELRGVMYRSRILSGLRHE